MLLTFIIIYSLLYINSLIAALAIVMKKLTKEAYLPSLATYRVIEPLCQNMHIYETKKLAVYIVTFISFNEMNNDSNKNKWFTNFWHNFSPTKYQA
jgi:hypothetical protein